MSESPYPSLKEIYRQQAEVEKDNAYSYYVAAVGALLLIALWAGVRYYNDGPAALLEGTVYGALAVIVIGVIGLTLYSLKSGIRNFDRVWENQLAKCIKSDDDRALYDAVERDLQMGSVAFSKLILTDHYLIFFEKMSAFYPITEIEAIHVEEWADHGNRFELVDARSVYYLGLRINDRGYRRLSSDEQEIRDIVYEIRSRYAEVAFTRPAHAYFFPPAVKLN